MIKSGSGGDPPPSEEPVASPGIAPGAQTPSAGNSVPSPAASPELVTPSCNAPSLGGDAHDGAPQTNKPVAPIPLADIPPIDAWGITPHKIFTASTRKPITVLSCFDGMGSVAILMRQCQIPVKRYIAVEINDSVKQICHAANPKTLDFPGVDHSWHSDIFNITERDIAKLDSLEILTGAPECKDMSKLRLLPAGPGYKNKRIPGVDPRPGLDGPSGKTFRHMLQIVKWAVKHHPSVQYFIECVEFSDLHASWAEVCQVLGTPYVVNAENHSYTARNRAYWTNFNMPIGFKGSSGPLNPDDCCDPGRTMIRYKAYHKLRVHPIGHSWKGDPNSPVADTRKPVLVRDEIHDEPQHLRPQEAERLMGMPEGCTAGPGITAIERLRAIGNAWDLNVTKMFFDHCLRSEYRAVPGAEQALTVQQREVARGLHCLYNQLGEDKFSAMLQQEYTTDAMAEAISLMALYRPETPQLAVRQPVTICSVLDSGSAMHIHTEVKVTNKKKRYPLIGFDGSEQWTDGCGYLPIEVVDASTDEPVRIDIKDAHQCKAVSTPILSMGKLVRAGWTFHLELNQLFASTPGGAQTLPVELGDDDIIRLPHTTRSGSAQGPLPPNSIFAVVSRTVDSVTAAYLHDLFNHAPMVRINQTLAHTQGLKPSKDLHDPCCTACQEANARRRGLRQKPVNTSIAGQLSDMLQTKHSIIPPLEDADDEWEHSESEDDDEPMEEFEYTATVAGSSSTAPVPRFDLDKLRPFEVMFCDNKRYDTEQRGGRNTAFLVVDVKTNLYAVYDLNTKKQNGAAFSRFVAAHGIHKLPYSSTIISDGCGSMHLVAGAAIRLGIHHKFVCPHEQSLNEAERICDRMFAVGRTLLTRANAPDSMMSMAVGQAIYTHNRMSTTQKRGFLTPFEMVYGTPPVISHMRPFWTRAFAHVPASKRTVMKQKGMSRSRAEAGRLIGYQDMESTTAKILLSDNRIVHTRNVTYDITDRESIDLPAPEEPTSEEANTGDITHGKVLLPKELPKQTQHKNPLAVWPEEMEYNTTAEVSNTPEIETPNTKMSRMGGFGDCEVFIHLDDQPEGLNGTPPGHFSLSDETWKLQGSNPTEGKRVRFQTDHFDFRKHGCNLAASDPRSVFVTSVNMLLSALEISEKQFDQTLEALCLGLQINTGNLASDPQAHMMAGHILAVEAKRDMNWKRALAGPDRDKALNAKATELDMMYQTILVDLKPGHPEYKRALKEAINGRLLLDIKRNGRWKARLIKQGFREDKSVDGPGFDYHANVASLTTVRAALFSPNWKDQVFYVIDVTTAFLQSDPYPPEVVKYLRYRDPDTTEVRYARLKGPIYGEASAPKRWEQTLAPWIISQGFVRGENEKCVYHHPDRNLLVITYVDDLAIKGRETDAQWFMNALKQRFKCKDAEKLTADSPLDYLGMVISIDTQRTYLSMEKYIDGCLHSLGLEDCRTVTTPMTGSIDTTSPPLAEGSAGRRAFMTMVGMLGWLANTGRPDVAYCHSRIAQHLASPTKAAYDAVIRVFQYLKGTKHHCLSAPLSNTSTELWEFYSDSDFAGNDEPQNRRRSQNGYIAMYNGAPVMWTSKVSSVAFAHPLIGEAHADISSGAAETYCSANATMDLLHLSYVVDEMGLSLPLPFKLQMDNTAAQAFAGSSVNRTKMKHIDCRQYWVRVLRDKGICLPVHVDTKDNLADLFTKPLDRATFWTLLAQIMLVTVKAAQTQTAEEAKMSK